MSTKNTAVSVKKAPLKPKRATGRKGSSHYQALQGELFAVGSEQPQDEDTLAVIRRWIDSTPMFSPAKEDEVGQRILDGDLNAVEEMVEGNLRWAMKLARGYKMYGGGVDLVDLFQAALIAMRKATPGFDYRKGSYANWVRRSINNALQNIVSKSSGPSSVPRYWLAMSRLAKVTAKKITMEQSGITATPEQVLLRLGQRYKSAKALRLTVEKVESMLSTNSALNEELDRPIDSSDGDSTDRGSRTPSQTSEGVSPELLALGAVELEIRCSEIKRFVDSLPVVDPGRDRRILAAHLGINSTMHEPMSGLEISRTPNMPSRSGVYYLISRLMGELRKTAGYDEAWLRDSIEKIHDLAEVLNCSLEPWFGDYDCFVVDAPLRISIVSYYFVHLTKPNIFIIISLRLFFNFNITTVMGVPKKHKTRSGRDQRRSHHAMGKTSFATCKNCGAAVLPHMPCKNCGQYKGRKVTK